MRGEREEGEGARVAGTGQRRLPNECPLASCLAPRERSAPDAPKLPTRKLMSISGETHSLSEHTARMPAGAGGAGRQQQRGRRQREHVSGGSSGCMHAVPVPPAGLRLQLRRWLTEEGAEPGPKEVSQRRHRQPRVKAACSRGNQGGEAGVRPLQPQTGRQHAGQRPAHLPHTPPTPGAPLSFLGRLPQ